MTHESSRHGLRAEFQVHLLGPVDVLHRGVSVAPTGSRRCAFVALLALGEGEPVGKDRLVSGLWGDQPPASAMSLVHTYVSLWRHLLDQHLGAGSGRARIARVGGGYRLALSEDELDVALFRRMAVRGSRTLRGGDPAEAADVLERALSLWRGDALADLVQADLCVAMAAQLEAERRQALQDWASACLAVGREEAVVGPLRVALDRNPLDESLAEPLMTALYVLGRNSDALAVYDRTRRDLASQLGADPGPRLRELHVQVLRHDEALRSPVPLPSRRSLPVPPDRFIGRDREVAEVTELLGEHRLVTVVGATGSGKTRLGLEVAARQAGRGGRDVRFVDGSIVKGPGELLGRVAVEVEVSPVEPETPTQALKAALGSRPVLLVLDNLEHLPSAAADVAWLLAADARVRLLVTSREPLGAPGEWRYPLRPLDATPRRPGDDLVPGSADELFVDRARAVDPTFRADEDRLSAVSDICRRLDGLPLAVELAVGWLTVLSIEALSEQLTAGLDLVLGPGDGRPDRQRTLRAAMDRSYELLDDDGRRLLRTMAVFRGGCDLDAIVAVTGGSQAGTLHLVRDLVDKSLLTSRATPAGPRFAMLETVRAYAAERLDVSGEADASRARHGEHYLRVAEAAGVGLAGAGQLAALDVLDADHDNIRDAFDWAVGRADSLDRVARAASGLWRFWHLRSRLDEGRAVLERLLAGPDARLDPGARAAVLTALGSLHYWRLGYVGALECYTEAGRLHSAAGDTAGAAEALCAAAYALVALARHEEARGRAEDAQRLYARLGDERGQAGAVSVRALVEHVTGHSVAAVELARHALDGLQRAGDDFGIANTKALLGMILRAAGRFAESEDMHRLAIRDQLRLRNTSGIAWCLAELAVVADATGDPERALVLAGASDAMTGDGFARIPFALLGLSDVRATTSWDPERARAAWAAGQAMTDDEAVGEALRGDPGGQPATSHETTRTTSSSDVWSKRS